MMRTHVRFRIKRAGSYLDPPFLNPRLYVEAMALLGFPLGHDEFERLFLPRGPRTADDVTNARLRAASWRDHGFSVEETRVWLDAGLTPREATLAVLLFNEGISPGRLGQPCTRRVTGERMALVDVARLASLRSYAPDVALSDVLDEWRVERTPRRTPRAVSLLSLWRGA